MQNRRHHFQTGGLTLLHGLQKRLPRLRADRLRKCFQKILADQVLATTAPSFCRGTVDVGEMPVVIDSKEGIGNTLQNVEALLA